MQTIHTLNSSNNQIRNDTFSHPNENQDRKFIPNSLQKKLFKFMQFFGLGLTSFSIAAFIYLFAADLPAVGSETKIQNITEAEPLSNSDKTKAHPVSTGYEAADEANSFGLKTDFSIAIPKIEAYSQVLPDINPANKTEYKAALQEGVAHSLGTSKPGGGGTVYLFSHSTDSIINIARYNAVFYALKDLEVGDDITIFYNHQKFVYEVFDKVVVSAKDTSWLNPRETETLILQTCDPPGTTWKRLLILAKPV